jgi:HEAT repeat protein
MQNELMNRELFALPGKHDFRTAEYPWYQEHTQERLPVSLALLLGSESDDDIRARAVRRLTRQGVQLLPLVLTTLNAYPEITSPGWPLWPPQYKFCARLLLHYCRETHTLPDKLLHHPVVCEPIGPVLWISAIEAAELLPQVERFESFFCNALTAPFDTVRYAAAMALANLAGSVLLPQRSLEALSRCLHETKALPVRLALAYALLRHRDCRGIEELLRLIDLDMPVETRKASAFVLATDPPLRLSVEQRTRLVRLLLVGLRDQCAEIGLYAADVLSKVAPPSIIPTLCTLLHTAETQVQIAILATLEGMAERNVMRKAMQTEAVPALVAPLLEATALEVRKQAGYTLAAIGGAYVMAKLGATILNHEHEGRIEAIESMRLLRSAYRLSTCRRIVGWLLIALQEPQEQEEVQITVLDSLAYLAWQAHARGRKQAFAMISQEIWREGTVLTLLHSSSSWVRQRTLELLSILDNQPQIFHDKLLYLLHHDHDSGVRACAAYICGQIAARLSIPDLIQALCDTDEYVAQTALNSLDRVAHKNDTIIVYVLKELAMPTQRKKRKMHQLVRNARLLLKAWEKKTS